MTQTLNGTPGNDTLTGANPGDASNPDGIDFINGLDGNDTLSGLGGGDTIDGGAGFDTVDYSASASRVDINLGLHFAAGGDAQGDTLTNIENVAGSAFNDFIGGDDGANVLRGGDGNDGLGGGLGADVLDGGAGSDWVYYEQSAAGVQIDLAAGIGHGGDAEGDTWSGIECIRGSTLDDQLTGDAGDNVFEGYFGADAIDGGAGSDTAAYFNSDAGVQVDLTAHTAMGGHAQGDTLTAIENLMGSAFNDTLTGDAGANALTGNNGDDVLAGGAGGDTIDGGDGIDTATYANAIAGVIADLTFGTNSDGDALQNIENLVGSAFADTLRGDAGANVIDGGAGDDLINAYGGADTINGGDGVDMVYYDLSAVGVNINLAAGSASGGNADGDTLTGIENLKGSSFADQLTGDTGANVLNGGDGNDMLYGGAGADVLDGGAGIDAAGYYQSDAGVTVDLAAGTGTGGHAEGDVLSDIENLGGSKFNDTLSGNAGINQINGGSGDDTVAGVAGNDTLYGGNGTDQVDGGDGWDTLLGEAGDDQLAGGAGGDTLRGGDGADHLAGGADSDTASYWYSTAGVTINLETQVNTGGEAQGDTIDNDVETINGSNHDDVMTGNALANGLIGFDGDDTLSGAGGNDTLRGGAGADTLNGGAGADYFSYTDASDSTAAAADTIRDFQHGDTIWVQAIDADGNAANGDTAFNFIGTAAFTGTAGQLHYEIADSTTTVSADVNGDGTADMVLHLDGAITLQASDFLL